MQWSGTSNLFYLYVVLVVRPGKSTDEPGSLIGMGPLASVLRYQGAKSAAKWQSVGAMDEIHSIGSGHRTLSCSHCQASYVLARATGEVLPSSSNSVAYDALGLSRSVVMGGFDIADCTIARLEVFVSTQDAFPFHGSNGLAEVNLQSHRKLTSWVTMPIAVVTGANSGIEGYDVLACDQTIGPALESLKARLHRLDVRSPESIASFAELVADRPVDILLNVAGVMAPPEQDSLATTNKGILTSTFETNTFGPLLLTQALLPNLLKSQAPPPRIGIVSSRVGSIQDNSTGGSYAYRASKAAVNSIGKSMAMDLKEQGVIVSLLHPGIVDSNLLPVSEGGHPEAVEPEEAAQKLWTIFINQTPEDTGRFWHREGHELPW
nr:c-factor [Quercus suber]